MTRMDILYVIIGKLALYKKRIFHIIPIFILFGILLFLRLEVKADVWNDAEEYYNTYGNSLFARNIRYYKGSTSVNQGIRNVLKEEPENFFYYNNGITIICDSMTPIKVQPSDYNMNAFFNIDNPQIVNGCQTVNSIYEFLQNVPSQDLEKEFKDTFVMLKILVINRNNRMWHKSLAYATFL